MSPDPTRAGAWRLARRTWALLAVLAALAAATGHLLAGPAAAWSAAIGVGLSAVLFGLSVLVLLWVVTRPGDAALGILIGGLGVRLAAYLLILDATASTTWMHREALAIGVATSLAVTLAAELVWLARTPQLFMIDLASRTRADAHAATARAATGPDRTPELTP